MRLPSGVVGLLLLGASGLAGAEPSSGALRKSIERIVDRPAFASAFWGIEVRSLRTGKVLYGRNAEKSFRPASTLKLVTTAAVLDALGPDARLRTTVETAGRIDAFGRVLGDLYLVGRGDPSLGGRFEEGGPTAALQQLAGALRAAGVRRIEGRLVGHEGAFVGERRGEDWSWEDLVWWYGAEVSALSLNDGTVHLTVRAGERVGDPVVLDRDPLSSYYRVVSTATTSAAGVPGELTLVRDPGSNLFRISGAHPRGEKPWEGWVALEDPARYAAAVFAEVLEAAGIEVMGPVVTSSEPLPAGARVLAARESPPLAELIKRVNKESHNLHAEMLLRVLGSRLRGEGSVAAGTEAAKQFLARIGIRSDAWAIRDGSGLSRSDLVTPHDLARLLAAMDRHPHARAFRDSLAVAGVDGTLKNRMRGTPAENRVVAKTGTLRLGHALAGYVTRPDGARLAFAVIVNNQTVAGAEAIAAIDAIAAALTGK